MPTELIRIYEPRSRTFFVTPGVSHAVLDGIAYERTERADSLGFPIFDPIPEQESSTMTDDQSAEERTAGDGIFPGDFLASASDVLDEAQAVHQTIHERRTEGVSVAQVQALIGIGRELRRIAAAQESASTTVNSFHIHGADEPRTAEEGDTTEPRMAEGGYTTDPRTAETHRRAGNAQTLGDIAEILQIVKDAGMMREGVVYALNQVYGDVVRDSPHTIVRRILTEKNFAGAWAWRDQAQADIVYDLMLRAVEEARR